MQEMILASQLVNLLEVLYVLVIDYLESGAERRPAKATEEEIRQLAKPAVAQWGKQFPTLRDSINAALSGRNKAEQLALLGTEIKEQFPELRKNERFTSEELETLNALGAYLRTDSEPALLRLKKMAGLVSNPFISNHLAPKVGNQKSADGRLRKLVQQLVGRDDTAMSIEESKQAKELHPDLYKQYIMLRRDHNQVWKDAVVSYIRKSGHHTVPYQELLEYLKANGIQHLLSEGFTGQIDDRGKLYTADGNAIDGAPNAVTFPTVTMNPKFGRPGGGDWVMRANREDDSPGPYYYTTDFKKAAAREKFAKVADLSTKMGSLQRKWFAAVKKFNPQDVHSVCAVVLEILYEFSARVGSVGNAAGGSSTYGVSTLLVKHVSVDPGGNIILRYKGKDGIPTTHKLLKNDQHQKFLIVDLMQLIANKQPKDRLFTVALGNGKFKPVSPAQVNAYFKMLGAGDVTVHKLRTFVGTKIFRELMEQITKPPKDEKAALDLFSKMAAAVGKQLNHVRRSGGVTKVTGLTAINNYIDPTIMVSFFRELGYRPPKFLEKFEVAGAQ